MALKMPYTVITLAHHDELGLVQLAGVVLVVRLPAHLELALVLAELLAVVCGVAMGDSHRCVLMQASALCGASAIGSTLAQPRARRATEHATAHASGCDLLCERWGP